MGLIGSKKIAPRREEMQSEVQIKSAGLQRIAGVVLAVMWVTLDQLTKSWAQANLTGHPEFIFGHVGFELVYNSGIAFGIASGDSPLITIFGLAVSLVLLIALFRTRRIFSTIGVALVLGGAMGNVVDRIFRHNGGAVIDFLHSGFWPTFNLADLGVVVGLAMVITSSSRAQHSS